jgi:hypothetical protein
MLDVLDDAETSRERREAKRRVLEIRAKAHELHNWISAGGLKD